MPRISNTEWSIAAIPQGAYLLDVIVMAMNTGEKMAYETVLIVLGPNQNDLSEDDVTNIIQIYIIIDIWIGFDPPPGNSTGVGNNGTFQIPRPEPGRNNTDPIDPEPITNITDPIDPGDPNCLPDSTLIDGVCVPLGQQFQPPPEPIFGIDPIFPEPEPEPLPGEDEDQDNEAVDEEDDGSDSNNEDDSSDEEDSSNSDEEDSSDSDNSDSDDSSSDDDGPVNFG